MENQFPISNNKDNGNVEQNIWKELKNGSDLLLISGFSSIEYLASKFGSLNISKYNSIRFLIGNEFCEEDEIKKIENRIENFWGNKSFQYKNIKNIKKLYDAILIGDIHIKIDKKQHSKIYKNENFITLGSSNFSQSGFKYQKETNFIFHKKQPEYLNLEQLAEEYWEEGTPYNGEFCELLEKILQVIDDDWRKSFTIIYDEFFLGKWYSDDYDKDIYKNLWKTQKQYLSRSLILLEMYDGLIVADPTGSGKTRQVSYTLKHLHDRYNKVGKLDKDTILIICPPNVSDSWEKTLGDLGLITYKVISNSKDFSEEILKAKVIVVDEAHSCINFNSEFSKNLLLNKADYKIFLTATPINKRIRDYYGLLMQFGADNLDDETFNNLNDFFSSKDSYKHSEELVETIKKGISKSLSKFTVRRTKSELNNISLSSNGKRDFIPLYPEKKSFYYNVNIIEKDSETIQQIKDIFKTIDGYLYITNDSKKDTIQKKRAKGLAFHHYMYCLRSSKAAALEHIYGTSYVLEKEKMDDRLVKNHNLTEGAINIINKKKYNYKHTKSSVIDNEINKYKEIGRLTEQLSDKFDESKFNQIVEYLIQEYEKHNDGDYRKILIFDRKPITVLYFYHIMEKGNYEIDNLLYTTGSTPEYKEKIKKLFAPEDENKKSFDIAFCTDVFSEGVNLQSANTLIFLDLPYTPKIVEQRIGRIDRMDSNHKEVNVVWCRYPDDLLMPNDYEFRSRYNTISEIIGSNYELPEFFEEYERISNDKKNTDVIDSGDEKIIEEVEDEKDVDKDELVDDKELIKINDAFTGYKNLEKYRISHLPKNLKQIIGGKGSIYSFVESDTNWGLFYLYDKKNGYPLLYYVDYDTGKATNDLIEINQMIGDKFERIKKVIFDSVNIKELETRILNALNSAKHPELKSPSGEQKRALQMLEKYIYNGNTINKDAIIKSYENFENKKLLAKNWHEKIKSVYSNYLQVKIEANKLPSISDIEAELRQLGYFEEESIIELLGEEKNDPVKMSIRVAILSFNKN